MKIKILLAVLFFAVGLKSAAQEPAAANTLLQKAYKEAKASNKNVLVMFHASWCGWCKKMDANMDNPAVSKYFDDNYVTVHLTVQESPKNKALENPGADVVLKQYKAEKAGLPFFVILDASGRLLEDSFNAKGENLGCPSSRDEVAEFTTMLKNTSKLKAEELAKIAGVFTLKK